MTKKILSILLAGIIPIIISSCYKDDSINAPLRTEDLLKDTINQFIQKNFIDAYGVSVRYEFADRYVDPGKRVTPAKLELVKPMLNFLTSFWIDPFINVSNGKKFFKAHVPAEVVFIGSPIFNDDGTITLGVADAGARITLTQVNDIDENNQDWIFTQIHTIYHEFAHIVHQRYSLPPSWQQISPQGYTSSGSWYNLTDEEALERGFVSPYATSSFNEDFAETAAFILFDPNFYDTYYNDEVCDNTSACDARNEGRAKIRKKYNALLAHYKQYTGVDLLAVRELVQAKL
jgi:substrate import-associated zinc metallohydrolase lipoprotein